MGVVNAVIDELSLTLSMTISLCFVPKLQQKIHLYRFGFLSVERS